MLKYIIVFALSIILSSYLFLFGQKGYGYYEHTYHCIITNDELVVHADPVDNSKNCFEYIIELAGIRSNLYKQLADINIEVDEANTLRNRTYLIKTRQIINQKITSTDKYIASIQNGVKLFESKLFQSIRKRYVSSLVSVRNKISDQNTLLYENMKYHINAWDTASWQEAQDTYEQNYYKLVIINGILDATNLDQFMPMLDLYNETFVSPTSWQ